MKHALESLLWLIAAINEVTLPRWLRHWFGERAVYYREVLRKCSSDASRQIVIERGLDIDITMESAWKQKKPAEDHDRAKDHTEHEQANWHELEENGGSDKHRNFTADPH